MARRCALSWHCFSLTNSKNGCNGEQCRDYVHRCWFPIGVGVNLNSRVESMESQPANFLLVITGRTVERTSSLDLSSNIAIVVNLDRFSIRRESLFPFLQRHLAISLILQTALQSRVQRRIFISVETLGQYYKTTLIETLKDYSYLKNGRTNQKRHPGKLCHDLR